MTEFIITDPDTRYNCIDDEKIDYGALSTNIVEEGAPTYYITTAIAYTNGYPHMGHAYEFLTTDVLTRYARVFGKDAFFCTGSDEHGQKVASSAAKMNRTPIEHCHVYVNAFKALNQRLVVKPNFYQRTTDPYHEETARRLWKMCADKGDIYLNNYEGWYNEREETFVTDTEAAETGFKDPGSGVDLKRVKEESYFFKMSAYNDRLIQHIETNNNFIQPENCRNSILSRLHKDGLRDLSISRTTFEWGISMPDGFDSKHVMYVWFDALTNYISGVHGLDIDHPLAHYWPAQKHIIGKDIIWFHCVIWPCMLMSANFPLPESIFSHGFVNAADGRKMSKSNDNGLDPHDILDKFNVDSVRYYMCMATNYGADLNFSETSLILAHNAELADSLGNLIHRAVALTKKYCDGLVPDTIHDTTTPILLPYDPEILIKGVTQDLESCSIGSALFKGMEAVRDTNKYITEAEPWKLKGDEYIEKRRAVVRTTLEAVYIFAHVLAPVIPIACGQIFQRLGTNPIPLHELNTNFYNLKVGTKITPGDVLFAKIETNVDEIAKGLAASDKSDKTGGKGKGSKGGKGNKSKEPELILDENQPMFTRLDLKVGRIVKVWEHPTADRLYCEQIDVGEESPRQIVSGLREHYTMEEMDQKLVIVVCNLKESKLQGVVSSGMVLCSKKDGKVELLQVPDTCHVGDIVVSTALHANATITTNTTAINSDELPVRWPANKVKKLKIWESIQEKLSTNSDGEPCHDSSPLGIYNFSSKNVTAFNASSICDAPIS